MCNARRAIVSSLKRDGNPLLDMMRAVDPAVDEKHFHDALTANLRRGRFLLLIVGDGIREGVEAIAEYLQRHAGLHFSLGLVEMPIYEMPNGDRLVAPRVLARTVLVTRNVVAVPQDTKWRKTARLNVIVETMKAYRCAFRRSRPLVPIDRDHPFHWRALRA